MGSTKTAKWVALGIFMALFIGIAVLGAYNQRIDEQISDVQSNSLDSLGSTNPSSPTYLSDDSSVYEYYTSGSSYYYRTSSTASSSYYHVVWVQPSDSYNDFNLYLYSDSSYSYQQAYSTRGSGYLDWVVFYPSSSQYYYPKVYAYSGTGYGYIEWEDSSSVLSIGSSYSCSVSSSNCIELYRVYLYSGSSYSFTLDVPSGADYDLYLYYLSSGSATSYSGYTRSSATVGTGYDESISSYTASYTGYYAITLSWRSGSGTAYLYPATSITTTTLSDDSPSYQYYSSGTYSYYQTGTASSSYYHVVWVQPSDSYNDFDLYLYSDSSYSYQQAYSTRGSGYLDWVVFYPSSSQYYYPKVYACSGTGYGYIEWEDSSSSMSTGSSYSCYPSSSNCIETYRIYLYSGYTYSFTLDVPSGADYDLYLYYLSSGSATGYSGYTRSSAATGTGYDESISSYTPSYTGYYAIIVAWKSGSGYAYLYASSTSGSYTTLSEESALYQSYTSYSNSYYQTEYAYSGYYHVIWLSSSYSDYLYLYSDSSFSYELALSARGYLNWVVVRPSSSQYYYPRVYSYSSGSAYIEWEYSSSGLYVGDSTYGSLGSSECVEIYEAYLSSSKTYSFTLDVPSGADYDLYLYRVYSGGATGSSGYSRCSVAYGNGQDESISNFKPSSSDDYLIMVVRSSGSGSFTLSLEESVTMSPGAIVLVIFGILGTIGISAGVYKKYSGQRRPGQPQRTVPVTPQAVKPIPQKLEPPKIIQNLPQSITCAYCQSKNDLSGLFCSACGSEL